ncbi:NAD-P-binding protein [Rhizophagus irregularis]|uniref:NAD-P-binding protein n=1 Tax=Rhizophagus irregularis TaxID=588596 RepID=A0A2N0QD29_9GLOM|nr:NAD-P-binding protein [Rhizophagus irregularis]
MVKVLVLGATGFIGFSVAQALARSGHETFGLYRKVEKTKELAKNEIFPILGDADDVSTWISIAEQVEVIIDATSPFNDGEKHTKIILDAVFEIGIWVYDGSSYNVKYESTSLKTDKKLMTWRPSIEKAIVESKFINGIVIRPGGVYGKSGSLTALWFEGAIKGELFGIGTKDVRWCLVHVDDLADSYLRAVERAELISGQIFNIINNQSDSIGDILEAVARITEYKGEIKYKSPTNEYEEAMASSGIFSNKKAQTILGWNQRQLGFIDGINIWWNSYKAYTQ